METLKKILVIVALGALFAVASTAEAYGRFELRYTTADSIEGANAYYALGGDYIKINLESMDKRSFASFDETLLHELIHWTMANNRVDREVTDLFYEELVAELGSVIFCEEFTPKYANKTLAKADRYLESHSLHRKFDDAELVKATEEAFEAVAFLVKFIRSAGLDPHGIDFNNDLFGGIKK